MKSTYDLLVLGPGVFRDALQVLLRHKNQNRTSARFFEIEKIFANPRYDSGNDIQEKIKLAIRHAHEEHGVRYVLLIGDVDRFPVRYIRKWDPNFWGHSFIPSDLYYADLKGRNGRFSHWDRNGNGLYGEMNAEKGWTTSWEELNRDQVDLKPDVAVGRLPVSTTAELETAVAKILAYEQAGRASWKDRAMLVTGDFSRSTHAAGEIRQLLSRRGYRVASHYWEEQPDWNDPAGIGERARLLNSDMAAGVGLVLYLGHGSETSWVNWYRQSDVASANNGSHLPVVLAAACSTATFAFRERDDGLAYYTTEDALDYGCRCEDDGLFRQDATFRMDDGGSSEGTPIFSYGKYGRFSVSRVSGSNHLDIAEGPGARFQVVSPRAGKSLHEFWRSLRSLNFPEKCIRHQDCQGKLAAISSRLDRQDATFRIVPGLADASFDDITENVSFESWNYGGWYLAEENGRLVLRQRPTCDDAFDCRATFRKVPGLARESWSSFELFSRSNNFIRHRNFSLYVESGTGELFRKDATFKEIRPQFDPLSCYISFKKAGSEEYLLYREEGGEYRAMLERLETPLDRVAATFRKLPALDCPENEQYFSLEALVPQQVDGYWRLRSFPGYHVRHQFFHLKVTERRPINLVDRPKPMAVQPDRYGVDGLCEEFLVKHATGAVSYVGSYTGVQAWSFRLLRHFVEKLVASFGEIRLGDLWNHALLQYMEHEFDEIESHLREEDSVGSNIFEHVHKMMLFGDPSLRISVPKK